MFMMIPNFKEVYEGTAVVGRWMARLLFSMFFVSGTMLALPMIVACLAYFVVGQHMIFDIQEMLDAQKILTLEAKSFAMNFIAKNQHLLIIMLSVVSGMGTMLLEFAAAVWMYSVYRFCCHYSESQMGKKPIETTENSILPS